MKRRTLKERNQLIYQLYKLGLTYRQIAYCLSLDRKKNWGELHEVYIGEIVKQMREVNHEQ